MQVLYIIVICVIIIVICYHLQCKEDFSNVQEKALHLSNWMNNNPNGNYEQFISANPESNIVEYTKLRQIYLNNKSIPISTATNALKI